MTKTPIVYATKHRIRFSDLDPYNHMRTAAYAAYYVDHRMEGVRQHLNWDLKTLAALPFMIWIRRLEIDFIRPAHGDEEVTITSSVREFQGPNASIDCAMTNAAGTVLSRCAMNVAYVDRQTNKSTDWPPETAALFYEQSSDG